MQQYDHGWMLEMIKYNLDVFKFLYTVIMLVLKFT